MINFTVTPALAGLKLNKLLKHIYGSFPSSLLHKLTRKGTIRINGKRCKPDTVVAVDDLVKVPEIESFGGKEKNIGAEVLTPRDMEDFKSWIIYEDKDLFVLNKPEGLAVQGGTYQHIYVDLYLDALAEKSEFRPRFVHRLDKGTSGVLLVAKSPQVAAKLSELFREKKVKKTYYALVAGQPENEEGTIDLPLGKEVRDDFERMVADSPNAKEATTKYKVLHTRNNISLVELQPITGRTHQIRAHCAYGLKTPVLGDEKYGVLQENDKRLQLHAYSIEIPEISLNVKAKLPSNFLAYVKNLDGVL